MPRGFSKLNNLLHDFKNLIEDLIQLAKNKMFSSKYVVKGKCKKCGKCCSTILLSDENGYIKTPQDFIKLQKRNSRLKQFQINGKADDEDENDLKYGALLFKCKFLDKNNKCKKYFLRPIFCRDYPSVNPTFIQMGGETLDGCGFYFDVDKKFSEY